MRRLVWYWDERGLDMAGAIPVLVAMPSRLFSAGLVVPVGPGAVPPRFIRWGPAGKSGLSAAAPLGQTWQVKPGGASSAFLGGVGAASAPPAFPERKPGLYPGAPQCQMVRKDRTSPGNGWGGQPTH